MYISSITGVNFSSAPKVKTIAKNSTKEIMSKDDIMKMINTCWENLNENPLSQSCFDKLKKAEDLLKKHYPDEYKTYRSAFNLH